MSQEYIEVTGNTEQDAINNALIQLKVTIDNLDYSVIDHGSRGFLGFFNARPAKIRARKKVTAEVRPEVTKKAEAPVKEKKEPVKKAVEAAAPADPARKKADKAEAPVKEKPARKQKKEESEKKQAQKKEEPEKKAAAGQAAEEGADNSEKKAKRENRNRGRKNSRGRGKKAAAEQKEQNRQPENKETEVKAAPRKKAEKPELSEEQIAAINEKANTFLKDVFEAMKLDVNVKTQYNEESGILVIDLQGDDMGTLIGKRGQTLDSLQYLVSLVVNKGIDGYIHVKADTENYRERRKQTLENLAKNIASKVKRSRKPVTLEPMNPYERRIIHSSLQNDRFVTTYSEGEEPYRRVIVTLKKQPRNRRNSDFRARRDGSQPVRETKEFRNENPAPAAEAVAESPAVTEE